MDANASRVTLYDEDFIAVQIQANDALTSERQPIHLIFVIDISDSMSDFDSSRGSVSKLEHVKQSITFLLPLLLPVDAVSLITFGDDATVHIEHQLQTAEGKALVEHTISQLHTDGCTNLSAGLLAMRDVARRTSGGQKPGVLLLTDGLANIGVSSSAELCSMSEEILTSVSGLTLTTVGYGVHHDATLLQDLARIGSGSYNIVSSKENIASTLGDVFGGLTTVVVQMTSLTLPIGLNPMTKYVWKAQQRKVQIGDLYAENKIIVLLEPTFELEANTTIQVQGVKMPSLDTISLTLTPTVLDGDVPKEIVLAYFRHHVSEILKEWSNPAIRRPHFIDVVLDFQTKLQTLPYREDLLVQMMLDDLQNILAEAAHSRSRSARQGLHVTYVQHAAYLSLGRGLRSDIAEEEEEENPYGTTTHFANQDPSEHVQAAPPLSRTRSNALNAVASPFSNRVQHRATESMREASQRDD